MTEEQYDSQYVSVGYNSLTQEQVALARKLGCSVMILDTSDGNKLYHVDGTWEAITQFERVKRADREVTPASSACSR